MLDSLNNNLESYDGFETDFVKILYYDLEEGYSGVYETKAYSRFCTIIEGEKRIEVKNKRFSYNEKQSLLLPPRSKVDMIIEKPTKALVFELSDDLIDRVKEKSGSAFGEFDVKRVREALVSNSQRNIKEDVAQLIKLCNTGNHRDRFVIDLYAQKLTYDLMFNQSTHNILSSQIENPLEQIIQYINNHLYESISVKHIASDFGMSESNFSHTFKKYVGIQPQKYIHKVKIELAAQLLEFMKVTDVAMELGYDNLSYFISIFKELHGMTPKQYQLSRRK